ncbi:hypothetical protein LG329_10005 [Virgibacillus necropolis]|uniref:hypothetical protein n=1 Tax=Virgibacillus necropolis TaxID=163877 RepID=UPI0038504C19
MNVFGGIKNWHNYKWFKVLSIIVKSFLALVVTGTFIFFSIMIYLLIQDYFYDEDKDEFNENGHKVLMIQVQN